MELYTEHDNSTGAAPQITINFQEKTIMIGAQLYRADEKVWNTVKEQLSKLTKYPATNKGQMPNKTAPGSASHYYFIGSNGEQELRFTSDQNLKRIRSIATDHLTLCPVDSSNTQRTQIGTADFITTSQILQVQRLTEQQYLLAGETSLLHRKIEGSTLTVNKRVGEVTRKQFAIEGTVNSHDKHITDLEALSEAQRIYNAHRESRINRRLEALINTQKFEWNWVRVVGGAISGFLGATVGVGVAALGLFNPISDVIGLVAGGGVAGGLGYATHKLGNKYQKYQINKRCYQNIIDIDSQFQIFKKNCLQSPIDNQLIRTYNPNGEVLFQKKDLSEEEKKNLDLYDALCRLEDAQPVLPAKELMSLDHQSELSGMLPRQHNQSGYGTFSP